MSLPASLLAVIESHGCITGCYSPGQPVATCTHPARPLARVLQVACQDCLTYHVGVDAKLLTGSVDPRHLADAVSSHVRRVRGYEWSISGYHLAPGFWLSAVYFGDGLFLVDASRNGPLANGLACLIEAFRAGIASPSEPGMLDQALYTVEDVFLDVRRPLGPVRTKQDILASRQVRAASGLSTRKMALLEYGPVATKAALPALPAQPKAAPRKLRKGEVCPKCKAEVKERPLLAETFLGCLC